jgi:arginyl-tRNA synthetase
LLRQRPDILSLPEDEAVSLCRRYGTDEILGGIKADLEAFRVEHQHWFSEQSLIESGAVDDAFARLDENGFSFERDGALWFATTRLGDDRDRVLRKSDGSLTYFASDIAYHHDKYRRGFAFVIDVWGADHHGYAPRMRAAIQALGRKAEDFETLLIQFVNLLEKGVPVSMSTRAGTFETLADVVREVGVDAARFSFLMRKCDSPLDFDLELAKQRSMDNPVYYVQYAHARICALLRRAEERGLLLPVEMNAAQLAPLETPEDIALLRLADRFGDVAVSAALKLAPHHVSNYLMELAGHLHSYYAKHPVLQARDQASALARLALLRAVGQVIRNALELLGVSAPEAM